MKDGFDGNDNLDGSITSDMDATLITSSNNRAGVAHSKESAQDANLVRGARATVLIVLLISAVTVASLAYFLLSLSESESFKAQVSLGESVR
jgi:hypothetical protein